MNIIKEEYLTISLLDQEIYILKQEIDSYPVRKRNWNAVTDQSALIVTDLQHYFLSPESHAFILSAPAIIPKIQKLISFFRQNGRPIIFTKHTNNNDNSGSMSYWWNDLIDESNSSSELYGELYSRDDIIVIKHQYDAFHGTNLESLLNQHRILYPVICGVMTNLCCETTVRTAFVKGFRPVLPLDATAAYNKQFHISTFRNLAFGFSPLLTTEEVIKKLSS